MWCLSGITQCVVPQVVYGKGVLTDWESIKAIISYISYLLPAKHIAECTMFMGGKLYMTNSHRKRIDLGVGSFLQQKDLWPLSHSYQISNALWQKIFFQMGKCPNSCPLGKVWAWMAGRE